MARPGLVAMPGDPEAGEPAITILEALLDHEVTFAVFPDRPETVDAILRQTGSHNVMPSAADYVLTDGESLAQVLAEVKTGDLEYPERSATIVCLVTGLATETGRGVRLMLAGPGIEDERELSVDGIDAVAVAAIQETNSLPPLGVDLVLVTPDGRFACLTRYTRLREVQQ
jgi:alpha-D-ribose 1-methylphosphonate 5-triphosphate synthase subunit PhnH